MKVQSNLEQSDEKPAGVTEVISELRGDLEERRSGAGECEEIASGERQRKSRRVLDVRGRSGDRIGGGSEMGGEEDRVLSIDYDNPRVSEIQDKEIREDTARYTAPKIGMKELKSLRAEERSENRKNAEQSSHNPGKGKRVEVTRSSGGSYRKNAQRSDAKAEKRESTELMSGAPEMDLNSLE
ncbi:hypothetical protein L210DRAFT_3506622 [Boletus edulis BED1]|uniref:Uncharacterized protein n=1 Tax=Boletus edulis BED1 TaxID=1328754 RepID=A0AAD4BMJ5_BOLED|nr:hypothetical protein L210DRAFT_3506622 [Boletus edulis BED1]